MREIVRAVGVPVTADVEGGYGQGTARDVAETVRAVVEAGVAGINLEDSPGRQGEPLLAPQAQAERIRAAREAAREADGDLVINARIDVYLIQVGEAETRLGEVARRARVYREAGADGIFVPGVIDPDTIARLVAAAECPLNVMALPGTPSTSELGRLGVARVSVGPTIAQAALLATRRAVRELLEQGGYGRAEDVLPFAEADGLFRGPAA